MLLCDRPFGRPAGRLGARCMLELRSMRACGTAVDARSGM